LHAGSQCVSGGTAYNTNIFAGGLQQVSGSNVYGTKINKGGTQDVYYGTASGSVISSGGTQYILSVPGLLSAGIASATNILAGAVEYVGSGGADYGSVVHSGGVEWVQEGGTANKISVASGGTLALLGNVGSSANGIDGDFTISSLGVTETGTYSNGTETTILNYGGGSPIIKTVSSGGTAYTYSGGVLFQKEVQAGDEADYTIYNPDGSVAYTDSFTNYTYANSAGSAVGGTVASGGTVIFAGGTASGVKFAKGAHIEFGGLVSYDYGGTSATISVTGFILDNLVVGNSVSAYVNSGNITRDATVTSGGFEAAKSGGVMEDTTLSSFGQATVVAGGSATDTVVKGGLLNVSGYTETSQVSGVVSGGATTTGYIDVYAGGTTSGDIVYAGGKEVVSAGGVASGTKVVSGFVAVSGGKLVSATVTGGAAAKAYGLIEVYALGSATSTTVNSRGVLSVEQNGSATSTLVNSAGEMQVAAGGVAMSTTIGDGGYGFVQGTVSKTVIEAGGTEVISVGGVTVSTTIQKGGFEKVSSGGTAELAQVKGGGNQTIFSSGTASGTIVSAGGKQFVSGGKASKNAPPTSAGLSVEAKILTGGTETVFAGGEAKSSTIDGGTLTLSGGYAADANVLTGTLNILSGGAASGGQIGKGAVLVVATKGHSNDVSLLGGAVATVAAQAVDSGSSIAAGASMIVAGSATGETIHGSMTVNAGGTVTATAIAGGTLTLNGGNAAGTISFTAASGELVAEAALPTATIDGFGAGDSIVLKAVSYVDGATATVENAGVVTITDGGQTYNLNIAGAAVGSKDFSFGPGSILTDSAKAAVRMSFIYPPGSASTIAARLGDADMAAPAVPAPPPQGFAMSATAAAGWLALPYLHEVHHMQVISPTAS
jgi:autotransporter passenger strand-loop-strand repeat protein